MGVVLVTQGLSGWHPGRERMEFALSDADGRRACLPIPTVDFPDVGEVLTSLAQAREPRVDVLIGPEDSGKSALVRRLAPRYRELGDIVRLVDLSLTDWRQSLLTGDRLDVAMIDHIDRMGEPERFRSAFEIIDRVIPMLFAGGLSRLMLTMGGEWCRRFRTLYRIDPARLLVKALPEVRVEVHLIQPYTDDELDHLCKVLDLDAAVFAEPSLRRAGALSLAAAVDHATPRLSGSCLREVLAYRWIEAGSSARCSEARRAIWQLMGHSMLRDESFSVPLSGLKAALNDVYEPEMLRAQVGGPLLLDGDQVEWNSPAWGDVAGANALRAAIRDPRSGVAPRAVRRSVLDALLDTTDRYELAGEVTRSLRTLRRTNPAQHGYLGAVLGTICARVDAGPELVFEDVALQGPDHSHLSPIRDAIAGILLDALQEAMLGSVDRLTATLGSLPADSRSGFHGGYEHWSAARAWARVVPLRAFAEGALLQLPHDGSWRYEDVLDVAVTGATTAFLAEVADALTRALGGRALPVHEYLADIWDGVNDGAWDQIDSSAHDYVGSLYLPAEMGRNLSAARCQLQRARFGTQDVQGWRLIDCDLLLADFRSCRNVEKADFRGSNWWSALLPPPARYELARDCRSESFRRWCAEPPWRNPYYTSDWPVPFR